MSDNTDDDVVTEVDAGGEVSEADAPQQVQTINREQVREETTRLIEVCAQSGIPADDVAEILRDRADAAPVLYEGMQRYGQQPDSSSD